MLPTTKATSVRGITLTAALGLLFEFCSACWNDKKIKIEPKGAAVKVTPLTKVALNTNVQHY